MIPSMRSGEHFLPGQSISFSLGRVNESEPSLQRKTSWMYRARDEGLYLAFAGFGVATFLLVKLPLGSVAGYIVIATLVPAITLIALIYFQVVARPRPSPLAFGLVFVGILFVAYRVLLIAAEASAAV